MHVTFKNCGPFTNCIIQIIITQVDNVEYLGILILMYDLLEYNNNYSKTSRSLWQYYKNTLNNNIVSSESFKFEVRITWIFFGDDNTKNIEIVVILIYLSSF